MTSILIKDLANELELLTEDPVERFITSGVKNPVSISISVIKMHDFGQKPGFLRPGL